MNISWIENCIVPWWDGGIVVPVMSWLGTQMENYTYNMEFRHNNSINSTVTHVNISDKEMQEVKLPTSKASIESQLMPWFEQRLQQQWAFFFICFLGITVTILIHFIVFVKYFKCGRRRKEKDVTDGTEYSSRLLRFLKSLVGDCHNYCCTANEYDEDTSESSRSQMTIGNSISSESLNSVANDQQSFINSRKGQLCYTILVTVLLVCSLVCLSYYIIFFLKVAAIVQPSSQPQENNNTKDVSMHTTLNKSLTHLISFLDDIVTQSNSTIIEIVTEESPKVMEAFEDFARDLLNKLSSDYDVTPVINVFDKFLATVNSLIDSMQKIKGARHTTIKDLLSFEINVNNIRKVLTDNLNSACSDAALAISTSTCIKLKAKLSLYKVQINSGKIDSDSSVTIVTLLDKIFKVNVTEIEKQASGAKNLLSDNLKVVLSEVTKLLDLLTVGISQVFNDLQYTLSFTRGSLVNFTENPQIWEITDQVDVGTSMINVFIIPLYLIEFVVIFLLVLVIVYFLFHKFRLSKWKRKKDANNNGNITNPPNGFLNKNYEPNHFIRERHDGDSVDLSVTSAELTKTELRKQDKVDFHKKRSAQTASTICTKPLALVLLIISCLSSSLSLTAGFGYMYVGSEVQNDACRYFSSERGKNITDNAIDEIIAKDIWPILEKMVSNDINIPIPLEIDMIPKKILTKLSQDCKNESLTVFVIFDLLNVLNITNLLESPLILDNLSTGKTMVASAINGIDANTLIPKEIDDILKTLPEFAKIVDSEDFSGSIIELQQSLLVANETSLVRDLKDFATWISSRNKSDERAVIIKYFAENIINLSPTKSKLEEDLKILRSHFETLQSNRIITQLSANLTKTLANLRTALTNKTVMQDALNRRFDQSVKNMLPRMGETLDPIIQRILRSVGYCTHLYNFMQEPVKACDNSVPYITSMGMLLVISWILLFFLSLLSLLLLININKDKSQQQLLSESEIVCNNIHINLPIESLPLEIVQIRIESDV